MFPTWSASLPKETSSAALGSAVFRPLPVMVQRAAVNYGLVARGREGRGREGGRKKKDLAFPVEKRTKMTQLFSSTFSSSLRSVIVLVQFCSVQHGISALGKAYMHFNTCLRSFPSVVVDTVAMLASLTMTLLRSLEV